MESTEKPTAVADAGPLIHLDELDCIDLLNGLGMLFIPEEVWAEVIHHRSRLSLEKIPRARIVKVDPKPSAPLQSLIASLGLDKGETSAITLLECISAKLFLCDDAAARLAAESLGFTVHGTIGILVRSIRTGEKTRDHVLHRLRNLRQLSSLHLSRQLLELVISNIMRDADITKET
jgi:predicted nucleic acid-binding protein